MGNFEWLYNRVIFANDFFVTDQDGNEMGLASDGSIFNEIPNADFQIWGAPFDSAQGKHKFLYLPTDGGQTYTISMDGTGAGTYTIESDDIENNEVVKTQTFSNLPVTVDLTGTVNLGGAGAQDFLTVKQNAGSEPETILPDPPDTIAPEAVIEFDPVAKGLKFSATEPDIIIANANGAITLTDQAGNVTEIVLKDTATQAVMIEEISSLKYNGVAAGINKNMMVFTWALDKNEKVKMLSQYVRSKDNFSILAVYDGKNTRLLGRDSSGSILKYFSGLKIIKITTNKGDFEWSY